MRIVLLAPPVVRDVGSDLTVVVGVVFCCLPTLRAMLVLRTARHHERSVLVIIPCVLLLL